MELVFNKNNPESYTAAVEYLKRLGMTPFDQGVENVVSMANEASKPTLQGKSVKCDSVLDYMLVKALFHRAGAPAWPWHKGYKEPDTDIHECPYYGWEPAGFMKHIFKPGSSEVITLDSLIRHVMYDKEIEHVDEQMHD